MIRLVSKSVLISIAAVAVMGCWASVDRQPSRFTPAPSGHESAVLRVSANAVPWSSHRLGEVVSRELVSVGTLKTVHYPIEPRNPPPLRIEIVASGEVNEHYVWGTFASILGGASLGLLLPVLPFFEDLDLSSEVTIHEEGEPPRSFRVETNAGVTHAIFADPVAYQDEAAEGAFRALGLRIAEELAVH
jgi:hypothetical protein